MGCWWECLDLREATLIEEGGSLDFPFGRCNQRRWHHCSLSLKERKDRYPGVAKDSRFPTSLESEMFIKVPWSAATQFQRRAHIWDMAIVTCFRWL
jgi:hypothetical protein